MYVLNFTTLVFICQLYIDKTIEDRKTFNFLKNNFGLGYFAYWIGNFLFDSMIMAVIAIINWGISYGLEKYDRIYKDHPVQTCFYTILTFISPITLAYAFSASFNYPWVGRILYLIMAIAQAPIMMFIASWTAQESEGDPLTDMSFADRLPMMMFFVPINTYHHFMRVFKAVDEYKLISDFNFFKSKITIVMFILAFVVIFVWFFVMWVVEKIRECCHKIKKLQINDYQVDKNKHQSAIAAEEAVKNISNDFIVRLTDVCLEYSPISKEICCCTCGNSMEEASLSHVYIGIKQGRVVAIIGNSISGKSDITKIISKEIIPPYGSVHIKGDVSFCHDDINKYMLKFTCNDFAYSCCRIKGMSCEATKQAVNDIFIKLGLDRVAGKRLKSLDDNERQKLFIALALLNNKEILVIDADLANIDTSSSQNIQEMIRSVKGTKTVILTSNAFSPIQNIVDDVCIIRGSSVYAFGSKEEILAAFNNSIDNMIGGLQNTQPQQGNPIEKNLI